jgi:L-threonylcarbamoyladenylate synthase
MRPHGPEILTLDAARPESSTLDKAATVLRHGGLVAFPTETFYGLGAAALDAHAAGRIFEVKARPEDKPLLVLVDSAEMAESLVDEVPVSARRLMTRYWPGPLTLVLRARATVPRAITAGTGTIGVRVSSHPVAQGLVRALGAPVTAPSANPGGAAPPTLAAQVVEYFGGALALVLDSGPTAGGPASTVLDLTVEPARVIRQGAVRVSA